MKEKKFIYYLIGGIGFACVMAAFRDYNAGGIRIDFSLPAIFGLVIMGVICGAIAYAIFGRKKK